MTRYSRQRTMSDCGPVAILNILKWAGYPVTYDAHIKHIKKVSRYVYTDYYTGVKYWNIRKALNQLGRGKIRSKVIMVVDLKQLTKHIENGGAFILRHAMTPDDDHYTAIVPGDNGDFAWINMGPKDTVIKVSPEEFERRVMKTQRFSDQVVALLVRKIDVKPNRKISKR